MRAGRSAGDAQSFFAANVDLTYLSQADIAVGRSDGRRNWNPRLVDVVAEEVASTAGRPGEGAGDGVYVAVCVEEGAILALAIVNHAPGRFAAVIDDIVVDQSLRSRGIGRAFIQWLDAEFHGAGAQELLLETSTKNHRACALYETLGFTAVTRIYQRPTGQRPETT